ncbi:MAG: sigma-70 family RNA polymerase sigma factor [Clostridia bacterium]|nr:sigma-70 family RNA polymerase sigma factor [Clostridia bacterium]
MNRENAEKIITEYLKPVFGFALKRCKSIHDAEDLSQDIILKAYRAMLLRDDIEDAGKFIWTVAHNALANYYRNAAKNALGISLDMLAEAEDPTYLFSDDTDGETVKRLQSEIAYLSKLQRRIVIAYYYENRKQSDIADELGIPLGTVKWHLFEAKKELKRGMEKMRKSNQLKFNPVKFRYIGINGSAGDRHVGEFLRSSLSQNICYDVRNEAKSVEEIADDLGVSPVYVESEIENLEEYGLLKQQNSKYIINFLLSEPTSGFLAVQDELYKKAASIFANELYGELMQSGMMDDKFILCNKRTDSGKPDLNYLLWTLIPFITAGGNEPLGEEKIKFEQVATIRPDGGNNIFHAEIAPESLTLPEDYVYMNDFCGPGLFCRDGYGYALWTVDTEWSGRRITVDGDLFEKMMRVLGDFTAEYLLCEEEYAWLAERGYVKTYGDYKTAFKIFWQPVIIKDKKVMDELMRIGESIKEKHKAEFDELKAPYIEAALETVPAHLKKVKEYELQHVFRSDGWFILHCVRALLDNGKLKPPTEEQKKALSTLIFPR